ncbi:hypothetical protein ACFL20_04300 [Spirochaetota bacterium]
MKVINLFLLNIFLINNLFANTNATKVTETVKTTSAVNLHYPIIGMGILTFTLLLTTAILGARRLNFKVHRILAIITIVVAATHATMVIISTIK